MFRFAISLFSWPVKKWKYESELKDFVIRETEVFWANEIKTLTHSLTFWTHEIEANKSEPLHLHLLYSETYPFAKHFKSLKCKLLDKTGNEIQLKIKEQYLEYFDGEHLQKKKILESVLGLIPEMKDFLSVQFSYHFIANIPKYPEDLMVLVEMNWEGEKKSINIPLKRTDYKNPKISPKF